MDNLRWCALNFAIPGLQFATLAAHNRSLNHKTESAGAQKWALHRELDLRNHKMLEEMTKVDATYRKGGIQEEAKPNDHRDEIRSQNSAHTVHVNRATPRDSSFIDGLEPVASTHEKSRESLKASKVMKGKVHIARSNR